MMAQPADELTSIHQQKGELYQRDMMLTPQQKSILSGVSERGLANLLYRWPEDVDGFPLVPYAFDGSVDQSAIKAAIDYMKLKTCIKFEERPGTTEPHLSFEKLSGCWSFVGYLGFHSNFNTGQTVSIDDGCTQLGIVVHEISHALGLFHEHSLPTRDDYVVILEENIENGFEEQFAKLDPSFVDDQGVPYDFSSDMHYSSFGFSRNGAMTIATLNPWNQGLIGQRNGLSHRDALLLNRMYFCTDKWLSACGLSSDPCQNDGYTGASCFCVCPPGTSGTSCENVDQDYYDALRANCNVNVTSEGTVSSTNYPSSYPAETCVTWITAPECMSPKITFTHFDVPCSDDLIINYVSRYSGSRHCGISISLGQTFTAFTNEMVLILFGGTNSNTGWSAELVFESTSACSTPQPPTSSTYAPSTPVDQHPYCLVERIDSDYHWTSPGYQNGDLYPNSFTCNISDVMTRPMQTVYKFNTFSLERKFNRCDDSVSVALPFSRFIRLCRPRKSGYRVPNSRFLAVFESDANTALRGFDITISHVQTSCHRIIDLTSGNSSTGLIQSPRFLKQSQCEWWIKAPLGSRIKLAVTHIRMLSSKGCTKAYVVIDKSGRALYERDTSEIVCGRRKITVLSSGDIMNVVFNRRLRSAKGFTARYTVV